MARVKTAKSLEFYGTGRRKTAIAKVWIKPGKGSMNINNRPSEEYFGRKVWELVATKPLAVTKLEDKFDIKVTSFGGGIAGQAGAVSLGISRALTLYDEALRPTLREAGLLTRDPRMRESKKYGRKRARRSFQWTKR